MSMPQRKKVCVLRLEVEHTMDVVPNQRRLRYGLGVQIRPPGRLLRTGLEWKSFLPNQLPRSRDSDNNGYGTTICRALRSTGTRFYIVVGGNQDIHGRYVNNRIGATNAERDELPWF